jgi:hypothetical protein
MSGGGQRGMLDWNSSALALGADRVLEKPFDQRMFLVTVQEVLGDLPDTQDAVLPSSATDLRKNPRLPVFLSVSFGDGVIAQTGTVVDISHEGCRIRCADLASEVKYVQVEILLDELHGTLTVELAVRRWSRNEELGTEFIRMEPDQHALLLSVLRRREEVSSR